MSAGAGRLEAGENTLIVRTEGRLFFANAAQVGEALQDLLTQHQPKILVLDLSRVPDIEYSALKALQESDKKMAEQGVTLWLAGCNPGVLEVVRKSGMAEQLARLLGDASESYVDNLIAKGHLISVTLGRRVLVPVSSYRAFIARNIDPR